MDINVTIKVFKSSTVDMALRHKAWMHHAAHLIFAVTNLVVLSWAAYHMIRYDGFGFYDYSDDGHGTISVDKIWNTAPAVQGGTLPIWVDEAMKSVCLDDQDSYTGSGYLDANFKHRLWYLEIMEMLEFNEIHVDFGSPVDRVILKTHPDHFPVCAKALETKDDRESYQAVCTELEYASENSEPAAHDSATHARNTVIALAILSGIFFIFQVHHLYYHLKAGRNRAEVYRVFHLTSLLDKKNMGQGSPFGFFRFVMHGMMYIGAAVTASIFLAYVRTEETNNEPGFDFTNYHDYTTKGCHPTPYAFTVEKIANVAKRQDADGTYEMKSSLGIISAYLVISLICGLFHISHMKALLEETFVWDDKMDKASNLEETGNDSYDEFEAASQALADPTDPDRYNTYGGAHIGSVIAGKLFRRGRNIVDLRF